MSVDIAAVKIIRVVKKSKFLKGAGIGLLIGGGLGFVLASVLLERDDWYGIGVAGGGILGSILGLPIGAGIGLSAGTDKTIQFEGRSELEIQEILEKLSKKARIRNVQ